MVKKIKLLTLFSFIVSAIFFSFTQAEGSFAQTTVKTDTTVIKEVAKKSSNQVIVYYFYGKPRCVSCKKIEEYTNESIKKLNNNRVSFKKIDMDNKDNDVLVKKYKLFTKSVVVVQIKNGKEVKSKNLSKIWTELGNKENFENYITKEIKSYLGG